MHVPAGGDLVVGVAVRGVADDAGADDLLICGGVGVGQSLTIRPPPESLVFATVPTLLPFSSFGLITTLISWALVGQLESNDQTAGPQPPRQA
ncbi:hypothetical protein J2S43_000948 [Catenuloplanes nepalensis]|uniref:Uncharacterized protein n=1 Tax=Catenuloplanes nepalensis TaxID=587533 RepID=A0ABT9MM83_9ACTN|nr:hypothetical protein [Catenuloplanes nepalensis]MDP9792436.1 hypothetical protein [Catenuloplanes nepalensis]